MTSTQDTYQSPTDRETRINEKIRELGLSLDEADWFRTLCYYLIDFKYRGERFNTREVV